MITKDVQKEDWRENLWVKDNGSGASLIEREREIFIPNEIFEKVAERLLTKEIQSKICALEKQVQHLRNDNHEVHVSNQAGEELLRDSIKQFKQNKKKKIDIIDLHAKTKLPLKQIGEIMEKLEAEGVVAEDGKD